MLASPDRLLTFGVLRLLQSIVRFVKRFLYPKFFTGHALRTVLVFRTGRLGDFINAIPALSLLRSRLPDSRIVLITTTSSMATMQAITRSYADPKWLPWLDFVVPSLIDHAVPFAMTSIRTGLAHIRTIVREERPDAVFVLPYFGETLGAKLRKLVFFKLAGFKGPIFGFDGFATRGVLRRTQYRLGLYQHEVFGSVCAIAECPAIGSIAESDIVLSAEVPQGATTWAHQVLEEAGFLGGPLVAIGPGATFSHKLWPTDRYVEVCHELRRRYGCCFIAIGAQTDSEMGARIKEEFDADCLDMTGRTSVIQLAALLSNCNLFVGSDSGPAHVASAVGCPCVTVTSALDFPGCWEPWNSRGRVVRARIECEFCLSLTHCPLGTNACILAVETGQVARMCHEVLRSPQSTALCQVERSQ